MYKFLKQGFLFVHFRLDHTVEEDRRRKEGIIALRSSA